MSVNIRKVRSRARKIAVEVVPAQWQDYLAH